MSVSDLIQQYGRTVTRRRLTFGQTTLGGTKIASEAITSVTMLIQPRGGNTVFKYGAERSEYDATGYCEIGTEVLNKDLIDFGNRHYRVDSVRVPDERQSGDALAYMIVGLNETRDQNNE